MKIRSIDNEEEVYIAGQTSPEPGLWITHGRGFSLEGSDILIRHLRLLGGDDPCDCYTGGESCDMVTTYTVNSIRNVVDHVSMHCSRDETASTYLSAGYSTYSNCILSHPCEHKDSGVRGFGPLASSSTQTSYVKCLLAHNYFRNPLYTNYLIYGEPRVLRSIFVNNLVYDAGGGQVGPIVLSTKANNSECRLSFEGNYFKNGPGFQPTYIFVLMDTDSDNHIFANDNYWADTDTTYNGMVGSIIKMVDNLPTIGDGTFDESLSRTPAYPVGDGAINVIPSSAVPAYITANCGAYPAWRSYSKFDTAAINNFTNKTGSNRRNMASGTDNYGGYGTMPSGSHTLVLPSNPHDDSGDGYTNLEKWLDAYADVVEGVEPEAPTPNPATFLIAPTPVDTTSVTMTATVGSDATPPVEYSFTFDGEAHADATTGGTSSGWKEADESPLSGTTYIDSGLQINKRGCWNTQLRDSGVPTAGTASANSCCYTLAATPGAPTVDGATNTTLNIDNDENGNPSSNPTTTFAIYCSSTVPSDANFLNKWLDSSGEPQAAEQWLTDAQADALVPGSGGTALKQVTDYYFKSKAKNGDGEETALSSAGHGTTTGEPGGSDPPPQVTSQGGSWN